MPGVIFDKIKNQVDGRGVFQVRQDALKKPEMRPLVITVASLRTLAYGKSFDKVDEFCGMLGSPARVSFHSFIEEIILCFGDEYLHAPNAQDFRQILSINAMCSFSGCVGSWEANISHGRTVWLPGPTSSRRRKKQKIILEQNADGGLRIWACQFGKPGSMKDVNVLDFSPIVSDIVEGKLLPEFELTTNGLTRSNLYFLVDSV